VDEIYEGVHIGCCPKCEGAWLQNDELRQIVEKHDIHFSEELIQKTILEIGRDIPPAEARRKLQCPVCMEHMEVIEYLYHSGIAMDKCPNRHGVWLDATELERAQIVVEYLINKSAHDPEQTFPVLLAGLKFGNTKE